MQETEQWRLVNHPTFGEYYAVSTHGRCARVKGGIGAKAGKILKPNVIRTGYTQFYLFAPNVKPKKFLIHRLVYEAFIGVIPEGKTINHLDGNKQNNHLSNLEVCTPKENSAHARDVLGKSWGALKGNVHYRKLSDDQVREIRSRFSNGETMRRISMDFDVCYATITDICNNKRFLNVQ